MSKRYEVFWTHVAEQDLIGIIEYIAQDSPDNAVAILNGIKGQASSLVYFPEKGRIVPELDHHSIKRYREMIMPPWRIIYRIAQEKVFILAVFDSRRNLEDILLRRMLGEKI